MTQLPSGHPHRSVGLLAAAHFVNDQYGNYLPVLLPVFAAAYGLPLSLAGVLMTLQTVTGSMTQPFFGYLADRFRIRTVAALGIAASALGAGLMGAAPGFAALALVTILHGVGTAAFHPQSSAMVSSMSGARKGTTMSFYVMSGQAGYALSPLVAATIVSGAGLSWLMPAAAPGLAMAFVLYRLAPREWFLTVARGRSMSVWDALRESAGPLARVLALVVSRSTLYFALLTFLPFLFRDRGISATHGAAAITAMAFAGAIGGLAGGYLSDRYGRRPIIFTSFALASPLFFAAVHLPGLAGVVSLTLAGGVFLGSFSILTVEAQTLLPSHTGMASGLVLGFGLGVGGLMIGPLSVVAQALGIVPVLNVLVFLPLATSVLAWRLPLGSYVGNVPTAKHLEAR
ncbi:MAG: MFS transporter [Armatimonadetes bacterium]|nr:MFS transporter [Armatimonadota bacterium]